MPPRIVTRMDPALHELVEGDDEDIVDAVIRLDVGEPLPPGVRLIARFGTVATCRLRRGDVVRTRRNEAVDSMKAARFVYGEPASLDGDADIRATDLRRPPTLLATGRGVVVAVLDWGCDFAHPDFRRADGGTRLLALWDQRGPAGQRSPQPYGYGSVHTQADIDAALLAADPYAALGYHPGDADADGSGSHGSHVMSIAAGGGSVDGPVGMAPGADLVFVHLATRQTSGLANLGDSVTILEGLDFVDRLAGSRPCVLNASVGRHGGPHDGTTLVEQGFDFLVASKPGRAIVQSCGNYHDADIHASNRLLPGEAHLLRWTVDRADVTPNELEVWYPGRDTVEVEVRLPGVVAPVRLRPGEQAGLIGDGTEVGRAYHRAHDPNNGNHHVNVFLDAGSPGGTWEIVLRAIDIVDGRFHAWVERDATCPGCQSCFDPHDADPSSTTGTICNGLRTIAVGAYDGHDQHRPLSRFTSSGPTLDGRQKPEVLAPGVAVLAARSVPRGASASPGGYIRKSGTSMAAPYVAGIIACMYEAAGRPLPIREVRAALSDTAVRAPWPVARSGAGFADPAAAVARVASINAAPNPRALIMNGGRTGESPTLDAEVALDETCAPGPEPDRSGRGLHPLLALGARRPSVGWAQACLNTWMARRDAGEACVDEAEVAASWIADAFRRLAANGQLPLRVDCWFGPNTDLAAKAFQRCKAIEPDGRIGPVTWPLLAAYAAGSPPSDGGGTARWRSILGTAARDGNEVVPLVDGPETFRALHAAIGTATAPGHYVYLLGWWLDLDEPLDVPSVGLACPRSPRRGPSTVRALLTAASAAGVQIRAMLWDQTGGTKNTAEVAFVDGLTHGAALLDNHQLAFFVGSQHQKLLVVKGTEGLLAFCGGVDVNCDRVCPAGSCPPSGSSGSASGSNAGQPLHDVHCRVKGPAANDLLAVFVKRWFSNPDHVARDITKGTLLGLREPPSPAAGRALVRVGETYNATATMPGGAIRTFRDRTVQEILLAVIGGARRFLYIEDQYLIGMCAAEAIARALPNLDHVTVLIAPSEISDLPRRWELRRRFIDHIRFAPHGHKLRVFVPCLPGEVTAVSGSHAYVHSKLLLADDEVAVIGSANVNRRGWEHDAEVVAAVAGDGGDGVPLARTLRTKLWAEHLGVARTAVADPISSKGLWLTAATRRVCPYVTTGGTDPSWQRRISEDLIDPPMPVATAPCCRIHGRSCPGATGVRVAAPGPRAAPRRVPVPVP